MFDCKFGEPFSGVDNITDFLPQSGSTRYYLSIFHGNTKDFLLSAWLGGHWLGGVWSVYNYAVGFTNRPAESLKLKGRKYSEYLSTSFLSSFSFSTHGRLGYLRTALLLP